jgi:hypothetical protein
MDLESKVEPLDFESITALCTDSGCIKDGLVRELSLSQGIFVTEPTVVLSENKAPTRLADRTRRNLQRKNTLDAKAPSPEPELSVSINDFRDALSTINLISFKDQSSFTAGDF